MTTFFITGTDTGIGKTATTGLAARYLLRQEKKVITQKLVQTGQNSSVSEDILEHRRLMGIDLLPVDLPPQKGKMIHSCPYSFSYPASPHLAAALEHQKIEHEILTKETESLLNQHEILLLEGAGGFLVPLTDNLLTADYIAQRHYPIILVTSGKLGSINHTLLTLEAIHRRKLRLACLVVNQYPSTDDTIFNDTFHFFRRFCSNVVVLPTFDFDHIPDVDFSCLLC